MNPGDHLVLIDGSSFIHRAYHAYPPLTRRRDGFPTGAISGFASMMWRILKAHTRNYHFRSTVTHLAVVMDAPGKNWRHDLFSDYKAQRKPRPDDLKVQIEMVPEIVEAFSILNIAEPGYEADDIMATYATMAAAADADVTLVTSDKDMMQLISHRIRMYDTMSERGNMTNRWGEKIAGWQIGREQVIEKFGVPPERIADFLALTGDTADNVPGVPKVGEKTAAKLVNQFGDVESVIDRAKEITTPAVREAIQAHAETIRLARQLVALDCDALLFYSLDDLSECPMDLDRLHRFCESMDMGELAGKVQKSMDYEARQ